MDYKLIICGGTFDRLHAGHMAFLRYAFAHGEKVIIGITSDKYIDIFKINKNILPFLQRKKEVENFLRHNNFLHRAVIVSIDSRFDQTQIHESNATALLVSQETYQNGEEINKEREDVGLSKLPLLVFPMVVGNKGERISSSHIREGFLGRSGLFFPDKDLLAKTLLVPEFLREILHKPFGQLISGDIPYDFLQNPKIIVTVGDVTTKRLHEMGIRQILSVVDFQVERKKTNETLNQLGFLGDEKVVQIENPAGQLSNAVWEKLLHAVSTLSNAKQTIVVVDGEEDLLVIPLILMLPLGFILLYGQPKKGVVAVSITEDIKHRTYRIIKQFVQE